MGQFHRKYTNTSTCSIDITVIIVIIIDNITVQNKISRNMRLICSITIHTHAPHISYKDRLDTYSTAKCTKIRKDTIQWNTALEVYRVLAGPSGLSPDVILQHDNVIPHCTVRHKSCCSNCSNIHRTVRTTAVIFASCLMHTAEEAEMTLWINGNATTWLLPQENYYNLCQDGTKVSLWLGITMQKMSIQ